MTSLRSHKVTQELPEVNSKDENWQDYKEKGDYFLEIYQCVQAVDCYNHAIDLLTKKRDNVNLVNLYCNRAICYCHLAEGKTGTQKTSLYNLTLKDAEEVLAIDGKCENGYIQKANALLGLNLKSDGILVIKDLLIVLKDKGLNPHSNHSVLSLLRQYKYYNDSRIYKSSPWYKHCRYSKRCNVVDLDGAAIFDNLETPLRTLREVSLLLRPGKYSLFNCGLTIQEFQHFDIIGDTRDEKEEVVIETVDSLNGCGHNVATVQGGSLHLINVTINQMCTDSTIHGILVCKGGKCLLKNVQGKAKAGRFCTAHDEGTELDIRNCKIKESKCGVMVTSAAMLKISDTVLSDMAAVGVDVSNGSHGHLQNSTFSKCGEEALKCHSAANGVEVIQCKFVNNSLHSRLGSPAVLVSAGENSLIKDCEILKTCGPGVSVCNGSTSTIHKCTLKGNSTAIQVTQRSNCTIRHCRMSELSIGLDAVHNMNGEIYMKDNTILSASRAAVTMTSQDTVPTMEGRLHKVKICDSTKDRSKHHTTKLVSPRLKTQLTTVQKSGLTKKSVR